MRFLKNLRKYKKAAMELSINAIVILIIALIVLGIGVVFVRGMFSKMSERVTGAISEAEVSKPATADQPMTLDPSDISYSLSKDTGKNIIISAFNAETDILESKAPSLTACAGDILTADIGSKIKLVAASQDMPKGKPTNWRARLTLSETVDADQNAVCTVAICDMDAEGAVDCTGADISAQLVISTVS